MERVGIMYYEHVFVALGIQHTMCMCKVICGLPSSTVFFHSIVNGTIKKKVFEHKMRVLIFSTALSKTLLILRKIE
jgi:hypothetical protein